MAISAGTVFTPRQVDRDVPKQCHGDELALDIPRLRSATTVQPSAFEDRLQTQEPPSALSFRGWASACLLSGMFMTSSRPDRRGQLIDSIK